MAKKILAAISLSLCFLALAFTVSSFRAKNWVNFDDGKDDREFGLFAQTYGHDKDILATWYCQYVYYCEAKDKYSGEESLENAAEAWCDTGTWFFRGGLIYFIWNLISFIFICKYILCCISIIIDRDPGKKIFMIIYAVLFPILSMIGFAAWWSMNRNVKYNGDWESDDYMEKLGSGDRWEWCAGQGTYINIFAVALNIIAGALAVLNTLMQNDFQSFAIAQNVTVGCLRLKTHFILIYIFTIFIIFLALSNPLIRDWVNFNIQHTDSNRDDDYTGSLYSLNEFNAGYNGQSLVLDRFAFDCIGGRSCEANYDGTFCQTFEPLMDAGRLYLSLEITVIGLTILWQHFFIYAIFFAREWSHPLLNYALPHLAWFLQLSASICWAVVSEVEFEMGDCENKDIEDGDQLDVCIKSGPIVMIVQLVFQVIFAVYFSWVYCQRGNATQSARIFNQMMNVKSEVCRTTMTGEVELIPKLLITDPKRKKLLPKNFPTVSPILTVSNANNALRVYENAFNGFIEESIEKTDHVYYAEIRIGDSYLIIKDVHASEKHTSPTDLGKTTGKVYISVEKCYDVYHECLANNFVEISNPQEEAQNNHCYSLQWPFGHTFILTEKIPAQEPEANLFSTLNPQLIVKDAKSAINWYTTVFNAKQGEKIEEKGKILHNELQIGKSILYIADEGPNVDMRSPKTLGSTTLEIMLAILNFDEQYNRCINHGFTSICSPYHTPWGNRYAKVKDPFGHIWNIQAKFLLEDEKMQRAGGVILPEYDETARSISGLLGLSP